MAKNISTTDCCVFVAIDIAKLKHDVLIKTPGGKAKSFRVANSHSDFVRLSRYLHALNCSGLIEPDTLIRDNYRQLSGCHYERETNQQAISYRV